MYGSNMKMRNAIATRKSGICEELKYCILPSKDYTVFQEPSGLYRNVKVRVVMMVRRSLIGIRKKEQGGKYRN